MDYGGGCKMEGIVMTVTQLKILRRLKFSDEAIEMMKEYTNSVENGYYLGLEYDFTNMEIWLTHKPDKRPKTWFFDEVYHYYYIQEHVTDSEAYLNKLRGNLDFVENFLRYLIYHRIDLNEFI